MLFSLPLSLSFPRPSATGKALNIDGWQRFLEKGRLRSRVAGGTFLILGHKNYKE